MSNCHQMINTRQLSRSLVIKSSAVYPSPLGHRRTSPTAANAIAAIATENPPLFQVSPVTATGHFRHDIEDSQHSAIDYSVGGRNVARQREHSPKNQLCHQLESKRAPVASCFEPATSDSSDLTTHADGTSTIPCHRRQINSSQYHGITASLMPTLISGFLAEVFSKLHQRVGNDESLPGVVADRRPVLLPHLSYQHPDHHQAQHQHHRAHHPIAHMFGAVIPQRVNHHQPEIPYMHPHYLSHHHRQQPLQPHHDDPKPMLSYIGLIAMAILGSAERKLVLSDIYQWILDRYPYFRHRGPGWRNSIRHNLSLNDCFVKAGRSASGKGHYWAVHPANVDDFIRGDFRRRRAQRKVRRAMGLAVLPDDNDDDLDSPAPSPAGYFRSPLASTSRNSASASGTTQPTTSTDDETRTQRVTMAAAAAAQWLNGYGEIMSDVTSWDARLNVVRNSGNSVCMSPFCSTSWDMTPDNDARLVSTASYRATVRRKLFTVDSILAPDDVSTWSSPKTVAVSIQGQRETHGSSSELMEDDCEHFSLVEDGKMDDLFDPAAETVNSVSDDGSLESCSLLSSQLND